MCFSERPLLWTQTLPAGLSLGSVCGRQSSCFGSLAVFWLMLFGLGFSEIEASVVGHVSRSQSGFELTCQCRSGIRPPLAARAQLPPTRVGSEFLRDSRAWQDAFAGISAGAQKSHKTIPHQ